MATKADFTEDEWKALQRGVTGAGALVSVSDRDFTDSFGEASALAKHLAEQQKTGATELMREIAHARGTGFGFTDSPQEVEAGTLEALRSSIGTLGREGARRGRRISGSRARHCDAGRRGEGRRDRRRDGDDRETRRGARQLVTTRPQPEMIRS